jgi:hypothetical protein
MTSSLIEESYNPQNTNETITVCPRPSVCCVFISLSPFSILGDGGCTVEALTFPDLAMVSMDTE